MTDPKPYSRTTFLFLGLVFVLALLFRDAYIQQTEIEIPLQRDALQYVLYGYNLANRHVYSSALPLVEPVPDSLRSPGYPLLVAACFLVGGEKRYYLLLLKLQALLGALTTVLTFVLAQKYLPFKWAAAGTVLVGISPHLVAMAGYVLTETLFGFLLLSALLWFSHALETGRTRHFAGAGVVFGMTYLTNETALFLPVVLVAAARLSNKFQGKTGKEKRFRRTAVFVAVFLCFPGVWYARNALSLPPEASTGKHRAIATATHGAYPDFLYKNPEFRYVPYKEDPMQPEFSASWTNFFKVLLPRIQERPLRYLSWYLIEKPVYLWTWDILQGQGDVFVYHVKTSLFDTSRLAEFLRLSMKQIHPFVMLSAFAGALWLLILLRKEPHRHEPVLIFSVLIYYTLMYAVFAPWPRYSVPLRPELYLGALWTLHRITGLRQP